MKVFLLIFIILISSCSKQRSLDGKWLFKLQMQNKELPFVIEFRTVNKNIEATLFNGKQVLVYKDVEFDGKNLSFQFFPFEAGIEAVLKNGKITGNYIRYDKKEYALPIKADVTSTKNRIFSNTISSVEFAGKWKLDLLKDKDVESTMGIIEQSQNHLDATIRSKTGDYGYLEGMIVNNNFVLYNFDGVHAYIFEGLVDNKRIINGIFYSGKTWNQKFTGLSDSYFELPNPNTQTLLKQGVEYLNFSLPDINGSKVSLQQPKFLGKIKVLQIFGSWCPNCLDETYFLSEWINQNPGKAEIIALSFESAETDAKAIKNIKKVINKTGASYTFLLASKNRSEFGPNKLFPDLVNFISYPTTIFLDKNNKVRKIHAGFNGPATGIYYDNFKSEFNSYINQLLKE